MSAIAEIDRLATYKHRIASIAPLTRSEEAVLMQRIRSGDERAFSKLVTSNLRFALSVAIRYQHQGVPIEDLVQQASLGLMIAARKFDETKGFKFISYAVWWIRQCILNYISNTSRRTRLPSSRSLDIAHVGRARSRLEQLTKRNVSVDEVAEYADMAVEDVLVADMINDSVVPLDAPNNDAPDHTYLEMLLDDNPLPDELVEKDSLSVYIDKCMNSALAPQQYIALRLRYGLGQPDAYGATLEETGKCMGISRERVRQIHNRAIEKLREAMGA